MKAIKYTNRPSHPDTDEEHDRVIWTDQTTGLDCLMKRQPRSGHWCGYVAVPPGHPAHGEDWTGDYAGALDVHGGVTYGEACSGDQELGVCHVPKPGEPDNVWWIGFDFNHLGDRAPWEGSNLFREPGDRYWTEKAVLVQVESAARQLAEMGRNG